jgi:PIN domain nuclease of toxin-antitoxin system
MILLDTHVLLWLIKGDKPLGKKARTIIEQAFADNKLAVSAITFWEIAMLYRRKRITLQMPVSFFRQFLFKMGLREVAITGEIGILAAELDNFHPDPADRIIAATALIKKADLITADALILAWQNGLICHDARH